MIQDKFVANLKKKSAEIVGEELLCPFFFLLKKKKTTPTDLTFMTCSLR